MVAATVLMPMPDMNANAQMVANRLRKNFARLKGWLKQQKITCYRLYDADLPEFAAAVDVYTTTDDERWAHVQEYQAPASIPEEKARARLEDLLTGVGQALDIPPERIAVKTRTRAKGGSQYGRMEHRGDTLTVREDAVQLEVNLFDYLDTGLFLDHRPARRAIAGLAQGRRFLNLFCYTASVTMHAATGGAAHSTSVDLSGTYLKWAARNLALNGLAAKHHRFVQADVMGWLSSQSDRYDLIFCDPPTFSNSKRAEDFDVQRDHVALLRGATRLLSADGVLIFSNNNRRFELSNEVHRFASVAETSDRMLDRDFARNPRIHRVWELRGR